MIFFRHFMLFIFFNSVVLLNAGIVSADINNHITEMLHDGQNISLYKDRDSGRTVISIGFGQHAKQNVAIDMAKQAAMKYLGSFLKGERVSATDVAEQKYIGDLAEESYYSIIRTDVNASLKSAYFFKSGKRGGMTYAVVIISEKSRAAADFFNAGQNSNIVVARGFASMSSGASKARNNAVNQALRNAVEQYAGVQMASKTSIENAEKYRAKLTSVSKGHVKKYEIKKEYKDGNNFVVEIIAEISEEEPGAETSIDAVKESMGRPSFYLITEDQRLKDMISEVLSKNDLEITHEKKRAKYIVNAKAKKYEYDVSMSKSMKGIQTTMTVNIKDRFSGEDFINVSNDPENSVEISESPEVRERNSYNYAMEELEEKLLKQINRKFIARFQQGEKILVKLVRFDRMRDVDELKECIDSLPMTKSVSVSPVENRTVTYEVFYLGNPSDLQLEIMKKSREFRLKGLRAKNARDGFITFVF